MDEVRRPSPEPYVQSNRLQKKSHSRKTAIAESRAKIRFWIADISHFVKESLIRKLWVEPGPVDGVDGASMPSKEQLLAIDDETAPEL